MKGWQRLDEPSDVESEVIGDMATRCQGLLTALQEASGEFDVKVGIGAIYKGDGSDIRPAVVLEFNGMAHVFSSEEALQIADLIEVAIHKFPNDQWVDLLSDIIMALRFASEQAVIEIEKRKQDGQSS